MQAIVKRETREGRVFRELECGCWQPQQSGGRSSTATFARCKKHEAPKPKVVKLEPAPAGSTCTAIVVPLKERRMRLCGNAAKYLNTRGAPRCGPCSRKPPARREAGP